MQFGIQFFLDVKPEEKSAQDYFRDSLEIAVTSEALGYTHVRIVAPARSRCSMPSLPVASTWASRGRFCPTSFVGFGISPDESVAAFAKASIRSLCIKSSRRSAPERPCYRAAGFGDATPRIRESGVLVNIAMLRMSASLLGLFLAGTLLSSCGGGSGATSVPLGPPPAPILINGATYQYVGIETVAIVYASPTPTNVNSNAVYTYAAAQTVNTAAAGAPAPFDANRSTTYTATQAPASGELLQSEVDDTYENQSTFGATLTVVTAGSKTVVNGVDVSAGLRLGNGPFNETSTTTTSYVTPQTDGVYPLQTGASTTAPLARTATAVTTDANAGGTYGGGGTTTTTYNNDGSFTRSVQSGNGASQQQTVNPAGTAQNAITPATGASSQTVVGAPTAAGSAYTIPVTITTNGNAQVYAAADWYQGGGQPLVPLAGTMRTVKGPVTLPSSCAFSGTPPPVIEVDVASMNLDPLGSYATTTSQIYNANGTNICRTQTTVTTNYTLSTGALSSTTTVAIAETLSSSNQTITGVKRTAK